MMAVNPERANELLATFQERVDGIVRKNGLEHHLGTANLAEIDNVKDGFIQRTMSIFTLPHVTEGEIEAEMNVAIVQIEKLARNQGAAEARAIQGIGSVVNSSNAADSETWNAIIGDAAHRIDKITKMYAEQINNMPKALRARIDDDFAKVLDDITNSFNADPSPGNANIVAIQVDNSLTKIERDLAEASKAVMKASIETIAQQKMTQLQEKEMAILSVEKGMTRGQIDGYRALTKEIRNLILELGNSNYLVYDKVIRNQKLAIIDQKMGILETLRINAAGVSQSLSGYFGNSDKRPARGRGSIGGVGTTLGMAKPTINAAPKNFRNGVPPGFAGFAGKMTKDDIAQKHPPGTAKSHIDAMHHYMSQGMSFEEAHTKASASGYTPKSHDKTFALGGGANPFF